MTDDKQTIMKEFRCSAAILLAALKYGATDRAGLCAGRVREVAGRMGGASSGLSSILDKASGGEADEGTLSSLVNLAMVGVSPAPKSYGSSPERPSLSDWAIRVHDLLQPAVLGDRHAYAALIGCLGMLKEELLSIGRGATAYAVNSFMEMLLDGQPPLPHMGREWTETLLLSIAEDTQDDKTARLLDPESFRETAFSPVPPSGVDIGVPPSIIIVAPDDYMEEEAVYVENALRNLSSDYSGIRTESEGKPLPAGIEGYVLLWPGRVAPIRPFRTRSARTFHSNGGTTGMAPVWCQAEDLGGVVSFPSTFLEGAPMLEESQYIVRVDRPPFGKLARQMEVASLVSWTPANFNNVISRLGPDYQYTAGSWYTGRGRKSLDIYRSTPISGAIKETPHYQPLSTCGVRCEPPAVIVVVPDDAEDKELEYVRAAMAAHIVGAAEVLFLKENAEMPSVRPETVVMWPLRVAPIRPINVCNAYAFKGSGNGTIAPALPRWVDRSAIQVVAVQTESASGQAQLDPREYLAEVTGLVFGNTARRLEHVSLVSWKRQTFHRLQEVIGPDMQYIKAKQYSRDILTY